MHRRFLLSQTAEQNAKIAAIDRQVAQKRAERATIEASIEKLEAIIPPLQERVEIRRHLLKQEIGVRTPISDRTLLVRSEGSRCKKTGMARPMLRSPLSLRRAARYAEYERGLLTSLPKPSKRRRRRTARGIDPEQIRHQFGGIPIGTPEMLRGAKGFGLKGCRCA